MRLLKLNRVPILEQLRLEEALLRADEENWCLISTGAPDAIVMGISGKAEQLLDLERVQQDRIPVIKRFSGGGTVYVDPDTIFVTFICNKEKFDVPLQPAPILKWSESLYKSFFPQFELRENDYVVGEKKIGGNAQYLRKERWLHHTSFLWDYDEEKMNYLLMPQRRPKYRGDRTHKDFLYALRSVFPDKTALINAFCAYIQEKFNAKEISLDATIPILNRPHRKASIALDLEEPFPDSLHI